MNIRIMTAADYGEVEWLWKSCPGVGLNAIDDSEEGVAKFLKRNPDTCFVAEEDNAIIGAIMAGNDGRRGYIYHTAVAESCRCRGIGSALVSSAIKALKANGINKAALVVFKDNDKGNSFWKKFGFSERDDLIYRNMFI